MKCSLLLLAPLLLLGTGCNTAQVTQPAIIDAGPPCPTLPPQITCDAGAAPTPGACTGNVPVELDEPQTPDASATVPEGSYALGCKVTFYIQDPESPTCLLPPACTCVPPEAGAADDAGVPPGTWNCIPAQ